MQRAAVNSKSVGDRYHLPEQCTGYCVYDPLEQRIGKAERVFVNGSGEPEYIRVKMGLFGLKSVLIPVESVAIDEDRKAITLE